MKKVELETVCIKIPAEDMRRVNEYAKVNNKTPYEVLQNILTKRIKEL